MNKHYSKKPFTLALGAALSLAGGAAQASLFQVSDLAGGYMLAAAGETKTESKAPEAMCGAKCEKKMMKKHGTSEADAKADCEKARAEGKCGTKKEKAEGKCGEGKCGDKKKAEAKGAEGKCGDKKK